MSQIRIKKETKQLMEDEIVDSIEKFVLGRFEDPVERTQVQDLINNATTDLSKRQILLALMEKDGTQTEKDLKILGDIKRMMKTFDLHGPGFDLAKDHLAPLVEHLREYVKVGEVEKKEHGEVMTPIWLVEDMLDKLPEHVWSNPSLKWLDPCNGCGVFPSIIVSRLMDGLQDAIPDQVERYRHIVENMIYVCDIQAKNCFLHMVAFDPKDLFDMNVYCGSFLDEGFDKIAKEVWGVDKFDIIVGNPPYQEQKPGHRKSEPIWQNFVLKALEICTEGALVSMVHPSGWRNVQGRFKKVQNALRQRQIQYLEMHNIEDGRRTFGATTAYDFYVVKNTKADGILTKILCIDGTKEFRCLDNVEFIPGGMYNEIFSLVAKNGEDSAEVIYSRSAYGSDKPNVSKEKTGKNIYPCTMNIGKKDNITKLYWSDTNQNGHFGIPKAIFGVLSEGVFIDFEGEYGLTQGCRAVVDKPENLEKIKKAMQSRRFRKIMDVCKVTGLAGDVYNYRVIALFRKDFWKEFIDD